MGLAPNGGARALLGLCTLLAVAKIEEATAQVRLTQSEALRLAFPEPARVERRTAFLTDAQVQRARELAGPDASIVERVVTYYVGKRDEEVLGVAYFDAHTVRTLPEVLMFVVTPDARIERIEVLRFLEPPEYMAPSGWLDQFEGREGADLSAKGAIVNVTGATLTSRAVTEAARRILALHGAILPLAAPEAPRGQGRPEP